MEDAAQRLGLTIKILEAQNAKRLSGHFMFGPSWDKPCPSCTSLMDGFDRAWYSVAQDAAFATIAKAQPQNRRMGQGAQEAEY